MKEKHDYFELTEKLLYSYPCLKLNLITLNQELMNFEHDNIKGIDFDRVNVSKTYSISKNTEDKAVLNIERIDSIKRDILRLKTKIDMIERSLDDLSEIQRKIIDLKYFKDESRDCICFSVNLSPSQVNVLRKRAVHKIKLCFFGLNALNKDCPRLQTILL